MVREGIGPAALLCSSVGLGLASAERKTVVYALVAFFATSVMMTLAAPARNHVDAVFVGLWASTMVNAACALRSIDLDKMFALALGINAGIWCGEVTGLTASKIDLLKTLPLSLCVCPAAWVRRRGQAIILKVLASWLIAVSLLAGALQFLPETVGYAPDHIE
jgi:ABC-type proline/glycine betaine transport system permease subunit